MSLSAIERNRFEAAYGKYADMLYRIALTHTSHKEDAEDIVHDVFIKYMKTAPVFVSEENEKAWLIRVTVNACHDLHRKKGIRQYIGLDKIEEIPAEETKDNGSIVSAIKNLSDKYRDVVILHYLENCSIEQCASILSLSESAVKMRLMRAREMLKKTIEKGG